MKSIKNNENIIQYIDIFYDLTVSNETINCVLTKFYKVNKAYNYKIFKQIRIKHNYINNIKEGNLLEEISLREFKKQFFSDFEIKEWIEQLLNALECLHNKLFIAHCDIKPE